MRKVKAKLFDDRAPTTAPNACWTMEFLSDQLFDGRKIRVLSVVENIARVLPTLDVRISYRGSNAVGTLDCITTVHARAKRTRLDNLPEFIFQKLDLSAREDRAVPQFSRPGKPTDHALTKALDDRARAECLYAYWFSILDDEWVRSEMR